jgi:hypothetical protein
VLDGRSADGASTNLGIRIERQLAAGGKDVLVSGNEIARRYRDEAFFQVAAGELVSLQVTSVFAMADYLMAVFTNGTAVPSPLFDKCPTVMSLMLGQPASFTLGAEGGATEEQWFLVDLPTGNYKFDVDAVQADGRDTNLMYHFDALDRFGQESRAKTGHLGERHRASFRVHRDARGRRACLFLATPAKRKQGPERDDHRHRPLAASKPRLATGGLARRSKE